MTFQLGQNNGSLPPAMAFKENTPGKPHGLTPLSNRREELIVQAPDGKPTQKHGQSIPDHKPHGFQYLQITNIRVVLMFFGRNWQSLPFQRQAVFLARLPPFRSKGHLHGVHAPDHHYGREDRVRILVEIRILQVVVVEGDENGQRRERNAQDHADAVWPRVRKGRIAHQTRSVDHGKLIDQLHGVYAKHGQYGQFPNPGQSDVHLRVEWKRKLPVPTTR